MDIERNSLFPILFYGASRSVGTFNLPDKEVNIIFYVYTISMTTMLESVEQR